MKCVLAVDGGNTKTIALVAALDGTILGYGRGGCGDIYNSGGDIKESLANIDYAVTTALRMAQAEPADLVSGVFNMAGADWPEDFAVLQAAMSERLYGREILIQNDALGILHAGTTGNVGVSVVCGTGAATGARGPDGRVWHSSFWQIQAEGSVQLSRKALERVFLAELGLEIPTSLTARVLDTFAVSSIEELLRQMTSRDFRGKRPRSESLTPVLLDEAEAGDELAYRLVRDHGYALGDIANVAARKVGIEGTAFPLVLGGGVFRHPSSLLERAIVERVRTVSPEACPVRARYEPVIGVLFSALELAGIALDQELIARLEPTIPDHSLFDTVNGRL
ncbi:N-acetylglucosamine kinase-like BadF-type ATPase [Thermosporothrix hazakensis]|jgi:N-acetylglucosamine kinase-like BadF-type ATPase|uniref:N-acetylglucosamine kinase-like BadF-type ATPase n=2 Tax=Thermosporothrix TaxID=768650 RepID=A0A326UQR5_THEHA|nr:BadF/BadG/BcrA/BcrD ATPase family protein [Thermosporothrix hazakensis]PZW32827.1 N-acetylglucosamine kinase-like BadF-type ATPase [Thermosporothrix hazakensis]BBH90808.1 N-acetylglucosamine kinase [Thermosporothrix sp. COM3]GCE48858.1 N-acetylglucosamine kinase [Thermosporothrix hazakensis]